MTEPITFILHDQDKVKNTNDFLAKHWLYYKQAETPLEVTIKPKKTKRSTLQNALLHAVLTDISKQVKHFNNYLDVTIWKRLCMAAWLRENNQKPLMIPALDGHGYDVIFEHTSKLSVSQCADFCTWCIAFGDEHSVKFKQREI
jgi:hypothetical protein